MASSAAAPSPSAITCRRFSSHPDVGSSPSSTRARAGPDARRPGAGADADAHTVRARRGRSMRSCSPPRTPCTSAIAVPLLERRRPRAGREADGAHRRRVRPHARRGGGRPGRARRRARLPPLPGRPLRPAAVRRRHARRRSARVDVRQSAGGRWPYASPAALSREAGGGVLLDFGVHLLDLLLWWLGDLRPCSLSATTRRAASRPSASCELALDGGAPVHFELSRTRTLRDTVLVEGERGTLELGVFEPALVRLTPAGGGVSATAGAVPDAGVRARAARSPSSGVSSPTSSPRSGVRGTPTVSGAEGRRAVALAEALLRAAPAAAACRGTIPRRMPRSGGRP